MENMDSMDSNEKTMITRQELYELVWRTPMRRLARQFGLSDVGLAKLCRRHAIPTPKPGYWAKKRHGKIVRRTPLPPSDDALITFDSYTDTPAPKPPKPSLVSTFFDPELGRQAEIEAKGSIVVPDSLRSPHPLVERTRDGLIAASKDKGYHSEPMLFPRCSDNCLDVRVGPLNINRAMRIMDAIIKAMEERGYKVSVPNQRWERGTPIEAMGHRFRIRLREPTIRQDHKPTEKERQEIAKYPHLHSVPKWDHILSNQLSLELQGPYGGTIRAIRDGKKPIEGQLSKILMAILRSVDDDKRSATIAAEKARVQAEIERQRREEEERRQLEERRRKEEQAWCDALFAEAARWDRCRQLREYLEAIRGLVDYYEIEPDSPLAGWLHWAEETAQRSDPLVALEKKLIEDNFVCCDAEPAAMLAPKPR